MAITIFIRSEDFITGSAPTCASCKEPIGLRPWMPPYRAILEVWGNIYGDIVFDAGEELLVSENFVLLYGKAKLTGLTILGEVEIYKIIRPKGSYSRSPVPKYYCVRPSRSRALVDIEASGLIYRELPICNECNEGFIIRYDRVVLKETTWSGEDIFFARGLPGIILTSERFRDFYESNGINGGQLIPARKYGYDFYPWDKQ
jgi:hypothetical protein